MNLKYELNFLEMRIIESFKFIGISFFTVKKIALLSLFMLKLKILEYFFIKIEEKYEWKILLIKPEDLIKIYNNLINLNKKILRRFYSNNMYHKRDKNDLLSNILNSNTNDHNHQIFTMLEAEWIKDKSLTSSIIFYENNLKCDETFNITEGLNKKSNIIEEKLNNFVNKGQITKEEKKLIIGSKQLLNKSLNMKKNKKIEIVGIQNMTTSSKKSTMIIEPNVLTSYPERNGMFIFNSNMILFFLSNKEEYRRLLWLLTYLYRPDIINQYNLMLRKKNLDLKAEQNMYDFVKNKPIENIKFLKLKESKEFNSNKETIFGYLLEELKK